MVWRSNLTLQRSVESLRLRKDEEINNAHQFLVNLLLRPKVSVGRFSHIPHLPRLPLS